MNIALFDSGIGGLASLAYFKKLYPQQTYHYFADFEGFPYGNKSFEQLYARCVAVISYLQEKEVTHIIVACNTATVIVQELKDLFPGITFVFGVDIAVAQAFAVTKNERIGLFATPYVVNSFMYEKKMKALNTQALLVQEACPTLAQNIEHGNQYDIVMTLDFHCKVMQDADIDTLILGCTHYGYVAQEILNRLPGVQLIYSDEHYRFFDDQVIDTGAEKGALFVYSSLPFDILSKHVQQTMYDLHADSYVYARL